MWRRETGITELEEIGALLVNFNKVSFKREVSNCHPLSLRNFPIIKLHLGLLSSKKKLVFCLGSDSVTAGAHPARPHDEAEIEGLFRSILLNRQSDNHHFPSANEKWQQRRRHCQPIQNFVKILQVGML